MALADYAPAGSMDRSRPSAGLRIRSLPFYLAFGSAVSILFSIAVSQILLAASVAALAGLRAPFRFPPIKVPLLLFFFLTIVADLLSGEPMTGMPQIRKLFVFAMA